MARIRASLVLLVRPTGRSTPSPLVIGDPRNRMEDLRPELPVTVSVSNPRMARSLRGCHAVRGTARWPCVCHRRCIMLVIDSVDKLFPGGVQALCGFSIARGPGILGLLGPNGAGKSTLMRILATVTRPTAGRVLWQGQDVVAHPQELRRVLGYLPQDFGVYPNLSAREFLAYLAAVKGLAGRRARARVDELLELVNLTAAGRRPLGSFSGGMRQRVGIAQALLDDPRLLIVDEPTAGLDPEERVRFRGLLSDLAGERVVILSTHIVSDVEAVASEIAIIDRGRLVAHGAPEALLRTVEGRVWEWTVAGSELAAARRRLVISGTARRGTEVVLRVVGEPAPELSGVHGAAGPGGPAGDLAAGEPRRHGAALAPSLEDAYLHAIATARQDRRAA